MRPLFALPLLLLAAAAMAALLSGAPFLEAPLPGGLPIGNALSALVPCAAAAAALALSAGSRALRITATLALLAALAWLPLSVLLAGNLQLNFSGARGTVWMGLSLCTLVLVCVALAWALLRWPFVRRAQGRG